MIWWSGWVDATLVLELQKFLCLKSCFHSKSSSTCPTHGSWVSTLLNIHGNEKSEMHIDSNIKRILSLCCFCWRRLQRPQAPVRLLIFALLSFTRHICHVLLSCTFTCVGWVGGANNVPSPLLLAVSLKFLTFLVTWGWCGGLITFYAHFHVTSKTLLVLRS